MSEENNQQVTASLEVIDIVNATQIMELAIQRNTFTVEELVQVAPVVSRFITFSKQVQEDAAKNSEAEGEDNE